MDTLPAEIMTTALTTISENILWWMGGQADGSGGNCSIGPASTQEQSPPSTDHYNYLYCSVFVFTYRPLLFIILLFNIVKFQNVENADHWTSGLRAGCAVTPGCRMPLQTTDG